MAVPIVLVPLIASAKAQPMQSGFQNDIHASSDSDGWSKESILTLIGVLVAILLFVIGLTVRRVRAGLYRACKCERSQIMYD